MARNRNVGRYIFAALLDPYGNTVESIDLDTEAALTRIADFIRNQQSEGLAGSVMFMTGTGRGSHI